jgi:hypothetical protein
MERRLFTIFILTFFFVSTMSFVSVLERAQAETAWDGPSQSPGAGLGSLAKPTNFIDASGMGTWGDSSYTDAHFRMNYVLSQSEVDTVQINAHANRFRLDTGVPIVSSPDPLTVQDLWSVGVGATYSHKMEKGEWGLIAGFGSNSDVPFNSFHEMSIQVTGTYTMPVDKLHTWIFFLSYANDRAFAPNVPFPGVSYLVVNPEDHLVVSYGLPFFLSWKPNSDWSYKIVYFIPTIINAEIAYKLSEPLKLHLGFDWYPQAWLAAGRSDYRDQVILDQKKASAGIRASFASDWYLDVSGGYAFDQKLFEAENLFATGINKNYLNAGAFVQSELAYRF